MGNTACVVIEQLAPDGLLTNIPNDDMTRGSTSTNDVTNLRIPANTM